MGGRAPPHPTSLTSKAPGGRRESEWWPLRGWGGWKVKTRREKEFPQPLPRRETRPRGRRESPLPGSRPPAWPPPHATSVNCPPNLHGHSKSRPPAPVHDPALHSPFPSPPPRPPPWSAPPSSRLCPRPRPPHGKFPPTAAALLRTRDPSRARHLGGLSPSFMGRWPLAVGASESAGVRPAQRFQGGCKGPES